MIPDAYCEDGRRYSVYNIYFDNETNDIVRYSNEKPYFKEKLRIRSYNPDPGPDDAIFIELKKKIGTIVCKRRAMMTLDETADFLDRRRYPAKSDFMQKQVLGEIGYFLDLYNVKPAVYIKYDRYAFFDKENPEFRLTFDSGINTRRDRLNFNSGTDGLVLVDDNHYVMEIKIIGSIPLWLARIMCELSIFSTGFSKYGKEYAASQKNIQINPEIYGAQYAVI